MDIEQSYYSKPADGSPFSTLIGVVDQAALQGLLRRLYSLGIPLISVTCLDFL
jgi:hypothetical protein